MKNTKLVTAVLLASVVLSATACSAAPATRTVVVDTPTVGALPDEGVPVDSQSPAVVRLDPELLRAVRTAAAAAERQDIEVRITSGRRDRAFQQSLFDDAVAQYGSEKEASRLVASPDTSKHVTGDAVDIGPTDAADWMSRNGSRYGLCQIFANELWHYELVLGGDCPDLMPDASTL